MADENTETKTETEQKPKRGAAAAAKAKAGVDFVRLRVAQVVWLVCVLAALCLAVGALLIALDDSVNRTNDLVKFVLDGGRPARPRRVRPRERRVQTSTARTPRPRMPCSTGASPRSCG